MSDLLTVDLAERRIAAVLCQLEQDTGLTFQSISVDGVETTQMESDRQEFQMRVSIEMFRTPSHSWGQ